MTTSEQMDAAAGERWKSRFLGAVDDQERLERQARERVGELGALLVRLSRTLPADQASSLNGRLTALSGALQRRPLDPMLSVDVRELQGRVLDVIEACETERAALHAALEEAVTALGPHCRSRESRRALKAFRRSLGRREPPAASELTRQLAALQSIALEAAATARPADGAPMVEPVTGVEPPPMPAAGVVDPAPAGTVPLSAAAVDWPRAQQVLAELAARLQVTESLREEIQPLMEAIEAAFGGDRLPQVLEMLRDVVDRVLTVMSGDFQGFLDSVDRRLDGLLAGLGKAREDGRAARALEHELTDSFNASLAAMRSDAARATRLDELKHSIESHLVDLGRSVATFAQAGDAGEAARDAALMALEQRLHEMERESRDVRGQLEVQRQLARTDPLTGLPNRGALDDRLAAAIAAARSGETPLSVAFADIDHFKRVNDRYGHPAGDRALQLFAGILTRHLDGDHFCARYGGEEFVMLFPAIGAQHAATRAGTIRRFVESCGFSYRGTPVPLTASFGVAALTGEDDAASLLERADRALYEAKRGGRNRVVTAP